MQVLYPLQNSDFSYGYARITYDKNALDLDIRKKAKSHCIYAVANMPLTPSETVNMRLMGLRI
jgi:hypothetical protein